MNPIHSLKILLPSLFTLLLLFLMGCGNHSHIHQQLLHAESIMEEHPDSAYTILSSLQIDSTTPEEDRALHALLLTQSLHKTHRLDEDNLESIPLADSLINKALSYYKINGHDDVHLMKAYYYSGVVLSLDPDLYSSALKPLSNSLEIALSLNDPFWIAKNYDCMGDVFFQGNALKDMVEAQKKALEYYTLTGRKDFIRWARMALAQSQVSVGDLVSAKETLMPLLRMNNEELEGDSLLIDEATETKAILSFYQGNYKECFSIISGLSNIEERDTDIPMYYVGSMIELDSLKKARELYNQFLPIFDEEEVSILNNHFIRKTGGTEDIGELKRLYAHLVSDYQKTVATDFNTIQMSIAREASIHNQERQNRQKWIIAGVIICSIILLSLTLYLFQRRRKQMKIKLDSEHKKHQNEKIQWEEIDFKNNIALKELHNEIEEKKTELKDAVTKLSDTEVRLNSAETKLTDAKNKLTSAKTKLNDTTVKLADSECKLAYTETQLHDTVTKLNNTETKLTDTEKKLSRKTEEAKNAKLRAEAIVRNKDIEEINRLVVFYYAHDKDPRKAESQILEAVRKKKDGYKLTPKRLAALRNEINSKYNDILIHLREDFPNLKESIVIYYLIGFNYKTIAYFTDAKDERGIINHIYYLRSKIQKLPEDRQKLYESLLSE